MEEVQRDLPLDDTVPQQLKLQALLVLFSSDEVWAIHFRDTEVRAALSEIAGDAQYIFASEGIKVAGNKIINSSEYRQELVHALQAKLVNTEHGLPTAQGPKKDAQVESLNHAQAQQASDAKPITATPRPPTTSREMHSPPYLTFWLGLTILAAVTAGWLAPRSRPSKGK